MPQSSEGAAREQPWNANSVDTNLTQSVVGTVARTASAGKL